jgi:hypothetical protein
MLRIGMLVSISIYALLIKQFPSSSHANPVVYYVIVLVAVWIVVGLQRFRRRLVKRSEGVLATSPEDPVAQRQWRTGYLLTYAFSEAIALYGVLLHFLGFRMAQVAPFLVAGAILILFYSPHRPAISQQ